MYPSSGHRPSLDLISSRIFPCGRLTHPARPKWERKWEKNRKVEGKIIKLDQNFRKKWEKCKSSPPWSVKLAKALISKHWRRCPGHRPTRVPFILCNWLILDGNGRMHKGDCSPPLFVHPLYMCKALGNSICRDFPAAHGLTGCDSISSLHRIPA